jgi:hypothetical protein
LFNKNSLKSCCCATQEQRSGSTINADATNKELKKKTFYLVFRNKRRKSSIQLQNSSPFKYFR